MNPFERVLFWSVSGLAALACLVGPRLARAQTVTCTGTCTFTLTLDAATAIDQVRTEALAVLADPSVLGITSGNIAKAVAFGLGFVMLMWFAGYVAAVATTAIRKL